MTEEKTFYVHIADPADVRRTLLGASKDIVGVLKSYDQVNEIREEKAKQIIKLKTLVSEIKRLNSILKEKLPTDQVRAIPKTTKTKSKKKSSTQDKKVKELEAELGEIESRLANIS